MARAADLETAVMERLWSAAAPLTVREVQQALLPDRPLAYTTVLTVVDRLHRKGLLSREPAGRAFRYAPTATRADRTAALMAGVLAASGDRTAALLRFAAQLPAEELSALRAALAVEVPAQR